MYLLHTRDAPYTIHTRDTNGRSTIQQHLIITFVPRVHSKDYCVTHYLYIYIRHNKGVVLTTPSACGVTVSSVKDLEIGITNSLSNRSRKTNNTTLYNSIYKLLL